MRMVKVSKNGTVRVKSVPKQDTIMSLGTPWRDVKCRPSFFLAIFDHLIPIYEKKSEF